MIPLHDLLAHLDRTLTVVGIFVFHINHFRIKGNMFRRRPLFIRALFTTWQKAHLMTDFVIDILIDITCYIHLDKGAEVIFFMVSEQVFTLNSVNILLGRLVYIRIYMSEYNFSQNS